MKNSTDFSKTSHVNPKFGSIDDQLSKQTALNPLGTQYEMENNPDSLSYNSKDISGKGFKNKVPKKNLKEGGSQINQAKPRIL